jgi:5-methylcytosine-specific restriction endonuclease McrA
LHPHAKRCSTKACHQAYKNEWGRANSACKAKWVQNNPEKRKKASAEYMKRNRPYYANYASLRTRRLNQAQPKWADQNAILDVYKEAEYFGLEVDHIIPLKHPLVCGLHVVDNLQLLSREENARKNNRFSVET